MERNQFGKTSQLAVQAEYRDGKTILTDVSFTAPYKLMHPFPKSNGGAQIIPVCASAGIMRGDRQEFSYQVGEHAELEVLSQSYDKIHKMDDGCAQRHIQLDVKRNATLYYAPQPVIPFAHSAFDSTITIQLSDESSHLFFQDILSCGRTAYGERFAYRRLSSKIMVYRAGELIYRDNTRYEPDRMPMEGIGMYEGYTHMANLLLFGVDTQTQEKIWELIDANDCDGGVTALDPHNLVVRLFGVRAQQLQRVSEQVKVLFAEHIQ